MASGPFGSPKDKYANVNNFRARKTEVGYAVFLGYSLDGCLRHRAHLDFLVCLIASTKNRTTPIFQISKTKLSAIQSEFKTNSKSVNLYEKFKLIFYFKQYVCNSVFFETKYFTIGKLVKTIESTIYTHIFSNYVI